jgi:hypothetical protein
VPVFILGLAFAMAAASKLRIGLDWILNGTVKYHFATDLEHAWVSWGVWLTRYQGVAIAMSAATVVIEALVITAAFSRSDRYRAFIGVCAALLLAGFAVFQGVLWPGWWILLLGFVPWRRMQRAPIPALAGAPTFAQKFGVSAITLLHLYVWAARVEARPLLSSYDMYSTTYDDDEAYDLSRAIEYRAVAVRSDGTSAAVECALDEDAVAVLTSPVADVTGRMRVRPRLQACLAQQRRADALLVEGLREVFNWETGRFEWQRQGDQIGPIPVEWVWLTD